jgi:type II restriction enzyme
MDLSLVRERADAYRSGSQRARVLTEPWAEAQLYCPACPSPRLVAAPANMPAYDLTCPECDERFQLKSKHTVIGRKIVDSAFSTMTRAIRSDRAPGLFVLRYDRKRWKVAELLLVPRFFLHELAIEKRPPLGPNARRAGWVGCNILLDRIPADGIIPVVRGMRERAVREVRADYRRLEPLTRRTVENRGWTLDVLRCVREVDSEEFTLAEIYAFEDALTDLHPKNRHVRDKIRQQLQVLRDLGVLEFVRPGEYRVRKFTAQEGKIFAVSGG